MSKNMLNKIAAVFISVVMMICIIPTDVLALGVESESTPLISIGNILSEEEGTEPSNAGEQVTVIIEDPENETTTTGPETENAEVVDDYSYEVMALSSNSSIEEIIAIAQKTDKASVRLDSTNAKQINVDSGGLILLSNVNIEMLNDGYTIFLETISGGYADLTEEITVDNVTYTYQGLGTDSNPFSSTLKGQTESYGVILNVPFFKKVDFSSAKLDNLNTLKIQRKNETSAMFAETASGTSDTTWSSLSISLEKYSKTDGGTTTEYLPGELIGTLTSGSILSLGTVNYPNGATVSPASDNAGLLCNTMTENSSLTVGTLTIGESVAVTANGSAGGLVGLMNNGASLTVNAGAEAASVSIGSNFTITGQNAGGLIGSGTDVKLGDTKASIDGATVNGSTAVGGLIGSYTTGIDTEGFTSYDGSEASNLKVKNVNLNTTADNKYAGGLFGALVLNSDFTISNSSVISTISGSKSYYGGLVGQVKGDSADSLRALTISGISNPSTGTSVNLNGYGGAVAVVGDTSSPVYIKIVDTFTPTFVGANTLRKDTYFGGVAAYLKSESVLELISNVTIAYDKLAETNGYGGGVLGKAERGSTLCLGGTTDLSGTKFKESYINEYTGQIVGSQESALIYAKFDWKLIRQSTAQELDDIGTYGEVIRLGGNMGMGTPSGEQTGLSEDLIFQNKNTHKTEFLNNAKNALSGDTFTVTSADQLALLAIEEQTKCEFNIFGTSGTDYYLKSSPNITLGENISLEHTGITGLQRDNGACTEYGGTLDGQNHTLTIAAGEIYGYRGMDNIAVEDTEAGSGQIHGHTQVGLFSHANATVNNLTIDGDMNLYFRTKTTDTSITYLAGGLVAKNTAQSGMFTNVTTSVNIVYQGTTSGTIGGLVGLGTALTLSGCTGNATIYAGNSAVYAGGLIGQYTGKSDLTVSNTTLSGSLTADGASHACFGGLVSRIANVSNSSYGVVNVTLTDITVDGQRITGTDIKGSIVNNVEVPASCGGLLGYEWNNASVIFGDKSTHSKGLIVKGNSSVTVNGTTETAGLVYAATGYWQVNDIKLQSLSVESGSGDLGLLICRGWRRDISTTAGTTTKPYLLYVEETNYHAYDIQSGITVNNASGYFDEWVDYTCEKTEYITNNGNSVISIATASETEGKVEGVRVGVDPSENDYTSYQNRTEYGKTATANPNARYYYDLDVIREKAMTNNQLDTPGELVLWAVWRYAEKTNGEKSNIADYFSTSDICGASMTGDGNCIDLTGYAYYPINVDGFNLSIININVKFSNQDIETAEGMTGNTLDSLNRTTIGTTESHTQHYLLHSGLLLNYQNSTAGADVTLTVSNVTFQGTIGKGPNGGSGALICGQLGGYTHATSPKYAKLDIQSVTLGRVSVNADKTTNDSYAPLLVNRVGSYSSLSVQNVSASNYSDDTSAENPAATSLIGHVGSDTATNITLAFSNGIDLNGKKENSIFSHATLLESFQYQSGGSGYYHFNVNETCTYGQEINTSKEYVGMQLWYYDDQSQEINDNGTKDFSTNYLPYVWQSYNEPNKYHELEINVKSPDLTDGCGTYDDPYIISTPRQLMRAADFINGNTPQTGWKVNMVDKADSIKTGENDNHITYEVGTNTWVDATMRTYMRGAYYKIDNNLTGNLTLKSFAGFGTVNNPFVGVFDGNYKTIIIENAGSGFINVSHGSVVRRLTIQYTGSKTLTDKRPTGVTGDNSKKVYDDSYFGGIIGTVLGGDSIIDNVTVAFADGFTINTSYDLQCAGGFVGLIQGGGVVFRNMGTAEQNTGYTGTNSTYYVDKYIGRVLDGYAINEVDSATDASVTFAAGSGKNYSIPDITTADGSISWSGETINIGNAQQMIIFTEIINSGAASEGTASAYASDKAKTRNADYSKIGNVNSASDTAFVASRKDDTGVGTNNYPYLISKYVKEGQGSFWNTCTSDTGISISFTSTSIDLSSYGNGYRGIGGRYCCNANGGTLTNNTPKINTVTGNNVSIHVVNDIAEYRTDNFYANAVGGLFNVLRHEGASITKVNVYGTVKVCSDFGKNTDTETSYLQRASVGGVIGRDYCTNDTIQTLTLTKVSFGSSNYSSVIYGECITGSLIGSSGSKASFVFGAAWKNNSMLHFINCNYWNVTVTGGMCAGGFVGAAVYNRENYIKSESYQNDANNKLEIEWTEKQVTLGTSSAFQMLFDQSVDSANGIGGLIGFTSVNFSIIGEQGFNPVLENVNVYGSIGTSKKGRVGALVGFVSNGSNTRPYTIQNISVKGCNIGETTDYDDNAGGIIGAWYSEGIISIENCTITDTTLKSRTTGGVVGYGSRGTVSAKNIKLSGITLKYVNTTVGGLGGEVTSNFYGQNVLMQNITYEKPANSGRFFGTGTNARLLGVTIQQQDKTLPAKDIYNRTYPTDYGSTNYVVYADYNNTVSTPSDITTTPSQSIPGITAGLYGDTASPNIVSDATITKVPTGSTKKVTYYQNLSTIDVKDIEFPQAKYNDHQDTKLPVADNFSVVLIDGDASVLKQYLNAATNGGFDSIRACNKATVAIGRYLYNQQSGEFSEVDASIYPPTLVYHPETGEFTTTAQYDNQMGTFTLVTVTMTESATGGTFVIHIPVIVRRMLQVDFIATMTSGTVFNKTDDFYSQTTSHALVAQGGDITGYLSFYYNRNSSDTENPASYDWQSYMEGGGDLLGYFKKTIDTGTEELPSGTKITLIDCQNGDKRYLATIGKDTKSKLELFNGGKLTFTASDGTIFTPATLSDLLQISAETAEDTDVKWVKLGKTLETAEGATVRATDGNYYRLFSAETDTGATELYTLTVGNLNPTENYFVVISVPNAENHRLTLDKAGMVWSNESTTSPPLEVHQVHRYNQELAEIKNGNTEASFNYLKNYEQSLKDNTDTANVPVQTSSAKVDIPIDIINTVDFTSTNYKDNDPLYQEFVIALKKRDNGSTTTVGIPSDAAAITGSDSDTTTEQAVKLYAYYKDSSDNCHYYVWNGSSLVDNGATKTPATSYSWSAGADSTEMVLPFAIKSEDSYQYLNLAALRQASEGQFFLEVETTLEMSTASVMYNNTIPYDAGTGENLENYTQINATSTLSISVSGLSYSTLKANALGNRKYYLNTERRAILKLDYSDIDQLGINLLDHPAGQDAEIDTVLTLDFSNMEGFVSDVKQFKTLSQADTVEFTLTLHKKGESEYSVVAMNTYMRKLKVSGEEKVIPSSTYTITLQKNAGDTYPCYNEQSGQFTIPLSFFVKTDVNEFANYRISAKVSISNNGENQTPDINDTNASITYTYAKINVNGYWPQSSSSQPVTP